MERRTSHVSVGAKVAHTAFLAVQTEPGRPFFPNGYILTEYRLDIPEREEIVKGKDRTSHASDASATRLDFPPQFLPVLMGAATLRDG